jgi:ankyrin repeat protein
MRAKLLPVAAALGLIVLAAFFFRRLPVGKSDIGNRTTEAAPAPAATPAEENAPNPTKASSPPTTPAPPLSPEAQKAFDVGTSLCREAFLVGKGNPEKWDAAWDAAIDALAKACQLAPAHAPVMFYLAEANEERKRFLTAIAWGRACLYAAPHGEFADNARKQVEYCGRQVEAQRIKIFATDMALAEKVAPDTSHMMENGIYYLEYYAWQRAKPPTAHLYGPPSFITDKRQGVLMDVQYVQAESGDLQPFIKDEKKYLAEHDKDSDKDTRQNVFPMPIFEHSFWDACFNTCLETEDWQGAIEALNWDYGSLDVTELRRQEWRAWASRLGSAYEEKWGALLGKWNQLLDQQSGLENLNSTQEIVAAWGHLAEQLGREEQEFRIEEAVNSLTEQAKNKQGNPHEIPLRVADLGLPLGKALRRIHALEKASDDALVSWIMWKPRAPLDNGKRSAYVNERMAGEEPAKTSLDEIKAFVAAHPGLASARGYWDATPLHVAALGWFTPRFLIEQLYEMDAFFSRDGRWFSTPGGRGYTPGDKVSREHLPFALAAVRFLLEENADVHAKTTNGWTPLHVAAMAYSGEPEAVEIVKALLAKGADVNARANDGLTPLHIAARCGKSALLDCLLESGAEPRAAMADGRTPLSIVARNAWDEAGQTRMLDALLAKGVNVNNACASDGYTALHIAARNGNEKLIEYLLAKGADVKATTAEHGYTALHLAAIHGHMEAAKLLVDAGVEVEALDQSEKTAAQLASENGHDELSEYLTAKQP